MTTAPPDRETLWQEAFDLLIRRQNAPDNPVTLRLIAEWRARSPVHDGIWREALELHALTGRAVGAAGRIPQPPARRIGRRDPVIAHRHLDRLAHAPREVGVHDFLLGRTSQVQLTRRHPPG